MKKLCKNEQTKIGCTDVDCVHDGSLSIYKNEMGNKKEGSENQPFKIRAYHPKMMIVYRGNALDK